MRRREVGMAALLLAGGISQAHAVCAPAAPTPSGEASLQQVFNGLLGAGMLDAATDCLADGTDAAWTATRSSGATIILELAGNANSNTFGIYDVTAPGQQLSIFSGSDAAGTDAILRLQNVSGQWRISVQGNGPTQSLNLASPVFGFYLGTLAATFYSDTGLNSDGTDHLFAYQGNASEYMSGPLEGTLFEPTDYILAWEDLRYGTSGYDADYQDFIVQMIDVTPVPLPAAVWLLGSGLLGLALTRRRAAG